MNISEQMVAEIVKRVVQALDGDPAPSPAPASASVPPAAPVPAALGSTTASASVPPAPPAYAPAAPSASAPPAPGPAAFVKHRDPSGIMSIRTSSVKPAPFDTGRPGDKVLLTDVSDLAESPRIGAGVMEMDHSDFVWTLRYDEWDYVIDGTLEILIDGRRVVGNAGDMIFIPANSAITFSCPDKCRFAYFVYPADWASQ